MDARLLFIVGCGRSGTTWVQLLLSRHPGMATAQETHLFPRYVAPLFERYERDRAANDPRGIGLPGLFREEEFTLLCRRFAEGVLEKIREKKPGAAVVVEKTPMHVRSWPTILRCFPEASFLEVIRDPRAVVASWRAAGRTWGRTWAMRRVTRVAAEWVQDVSCGRALAERTQRRAEVRYENLVADPAAEIGRIFRWLELAAGAEECKRYVEECSFGRLKAAEAGAEGTGSYPWDLSREPQGFFRRGETDAWKEELSARQVHGIERVAGAWMDRLGYARMSPH